MQETLTKPKIKEPFYFNEEQYNYRKGKDDEAMKIANELISQTRKALGIEFKLDYDQLFDSPGEYVSQTYYNTFSNRNLPIHVEINFSAILLQDTSINTADLNNLLREFKKLCNGLGKHAPTVTKEGIISNIKKENYYYDLDKDKAEMYKTGVKLVEALNKMASYFPGNGLYHLFQTKFFALYVDNLYSWKIDKSKFIN